MSQVARAIPFVAIALCISSSSLVGLPAPDPPAPSSAASPTPETAALAPADCLAALDELNDAGKLVPEAAFPGVRLKGLAEDGCSGVRWNSGKRLVAIDLGQSGFEGSITEQGDDGSFGEPLAFRMMGFLHSETPFSIAGQTLPAGAYAVEAFNASLRLIGNHETATRFDPMQRKEIPLSRTVKLDLKLPIPSSLVGSDATEIPHYAVALDGASVVLRVQGKEWTLKPR